MMHRPIRALPLLLASTLVVTFGCDRVGQPTEAEAGAARITAVANEARALTRRLAFSSDAVGTELAGEDGAAREVTKPMLAPAVAAEELRALASRAQSAGATETQRKEAGALAQRLRREAAMLDLVALERTFSQMQALTDAIGAELDEARAIESSAGPSALAAAEARVKATRAVLANFRSALEQQQTALSAEEAELSRIETDVRTANERAEAVDAEAQVLRSEAATSAPSTARPKVDAAVAKMNEARVLRREAADREIGAVALRSDVGMARAANQSAQEAEQWIAGRLSSAEGAVKAAKTRSEASMQAIKDLREAAATQMEELGKLTQGEFTPLFERLKETLSGNIATKSPTDGALMALAKARLYQIAAGAAAQAVELGSAQGAPAEVLAAVEGQRKASLEQARAALVEARDALSGGSSQGAEALLATVQQLAQTLGVDINAPVAPVAPAAEPPAADEGSEGGAAEAPASEAPASEPPAADAPAGAEPGSDEPAPPAEPAADEPNK